MLPLIAALGVGAIVPAQTAINTRLRAAVGSPIVAAFYSFVIGATVTVVAVGLITGEFLPDLQILFAEPWWVWIGGFMGVTFITGNILLFPHLGSVETVVLPILGQAIMGLVVDQFGLFGSRQLDVGLARVLSAAVVVLGTLLVIRSGTRTQVDHGPTQWLWRLFGLFIGMCSATQTAVNGHLGSALSSPVHAGALSLAVGMVVLGVLSVFAKKQPRRGPVFTRGPWWMWLGGLLGSLFVIGNATIAPILGTGTTVIAAVSGTVICGQLVEALGLFGTRRVPLDARRVLGLALILVGVFLVHHF